MPIVFSSMPPTIPHKRLHEPVKSHAYLEELQKKISEAIDAFITEEHHLSCKRCSDMKRLCQGIKDYFPEFPLTGSCSDQAIFLEERTKEKDSTSPSFITQEKHSNKLLIEELNKIRLENDRLKLELTTKSDQWRQIKETLQNRQSVKRKLGHLLEDDSENRDPEKNEMLAETHLTRNLISEPEFDRISLLSKISDSKEDLRQPPYNTDQISNATTDEAGGMKPIAIIKKHDRDCPCCTKFYDAIKTGASDIEARKGIITRHKFRENMPGTPPGFWSVGFTQDS